MQSRLVLQHLKNIIFVMLKLSFKGEKINAMKKIDVRH